MLSPADVDMLLELLSEVAHWYLLGVPLDVQSGASRDNAKFETKRRSTALSMVVQLMQRNAFYFLLKFAVFVLQVQSCLGYLIELVNLFRLETALRLLLIMAGDVEPNPGPTGESCNYTGSCSNCKLHLLHCTYREGEVLYMYLYRFIAVCVKNRLLYVCIILCLFIPMLLQIPGQP